jgi:5-(carboxyamino)imidazole ribonucleotide mutase
MAQMAQMAQMGIPSVKSVKSVAKDLFGLWRRQGDNFAAPRYIRAAMKEKSTVRPAVAIVMGSDSDWPTMKAAAEVCSEFGIAHEVRVISAHRTPQDLSRFAQDAHKRGVRVFIAGAGGAAHLPGVIAAYTPLPVIGVPIMSKALKGLDSLFSIVQMPSGVPVATVAIEGGRNAGILAAQILGVGDADLQAKVIAFKARLAEESRAKDRDLER